MHSALTAIRAFAVVAYGDAGEDDDSAAYPAAASDLHWESDRYVAPHASKQLL